ncbi:MAG: hypothetical protein M0R75_04675 [Dehalococcoidia bacterium]|nr:hypothetical protein [Dehalococcoidia bacterium]
MATEKMSVSFPTELSEEIRQDARAAGMTVSAWLAEAAAAQLRSKGLGDLLDEYEREHGAFTEEELEEARVRMGYPPARGRRRSVA